MTQEDATDNRMTVASSSASLARPQNPTRLFDLGDRVRLQATVRIGSELRLLGTANKKIGRESALLCCIDRGLRWFYPFIVSLSSIVPWVHLPRRCVVR